VLVLRLAKGDGITMGISEICFLLIQGKVVNVSSRPDMLDYSLIDDNNDFQVAVGCINEFGKAEVVDVAAEAYPTPGCVYWIVSSDLDGYNRMIGITGSMAEFVQGRLCIYLRQGRFHDLCCLPQLITIRGDK